VASITVKEFLKLSKEGKIIKPDGEECGLCPTELHEIETGRRKYGEKLCCSDCYFEKFGELIDQHPIGVPHTQK